MKKWFLALVMVIVLSACGDAEQTKKSVEDTIEEGVVGFEMAGGNIEEASGVPNDQKMQLLAAFEEYIAAFNAENIERYGQTTSKHAKGFNYKEDLIEVQKVFDTYAVHRQAEDVTIVKYSENEAHVYANLSIEMTEEATNTVVASEGRQVTVFVNEEDAWKVSSVYYIGNH